MVFTDVMLEPLDMCACCDVSMRALGSPAMRQAISSPDLCKTRTHLGGVARVSVLY